MKQLDNFHVDFSPLTKRLRIVQVRKGTDVILGEKEAEAEIVTAFIRFMTDEFRDGSVFDVKIPDGEFEISVKRIQKESKPVPLTCEAKAGSLTMRVGPESLKFAAENHPDFDTEYDPDTTGVTVSDIDVFSREVAREINAEDEDGSTLLTRMMDTAIRQAVENGCEGIDYD